MTIPIKQGGTGAATAVSARTALGLGTASTLDVGTTANNVVALDGSARLPAVDGSLLTNLPGGGGGGATLADAAELAAGTTTAKAPSVAGVRDIGIPTEGPRFGVATPNLSVLSRHMRQGLISSEAWINPAEHLGIRRRTSNTDHTAILQTIFASGEDVFFEGGRYNVSDVLTQTQERVTLAGAGAYRTTFYVRSGATQGHNGYLKMTHLCSTRDLGIDFEQNTAVTARASLTNFAPAMDLRFCTNSDFKNILIERARTGIYAIHVPNDNTATAAEKAVPRAAGACHFDGIRIGAYDYGFRCDGALDFVSLDQYNFWPYGIAGTPSEAIYDDGATVALDIGQCEFFSGGVICMFHGQAIFRSSPAGHAGLCGGSIGTLSLDGSGSTLVIQDGARMNIGAAYSTKGTVLGGNNATVQSIRASGANTVLNIGTFDTSTNGPINDWSITTGAHVNIGSGSLVQNAEQSQIAIVQDQNSRLTLGRGVTVRATTIGGAAFQVRSQPFFSQLAGAAISSDATFLWRTVTNGGSDTGIAFSFAGDQPNNSVDAARIKGWTVARPTMTGNGWYGQQVYRGVLGSNGRAVIAHGYSGTSEPWKLFTMACTVYAASGSTNGYVLMGSANNATPLIADANNIYINNFADEPTMAGNAYVLTLTPTRPT